MTPCLHRLSIGARTYLLFSREKMEETSGTATEKDRLQV